MPALGYVRVSPEDVCRPFPRLGRSRRSLAGLLGLPCALKEIADESQENL
jgi:hypothetical protein